MGYTTFTMPPIFRFFGWRQRRASLCAFCHKEPKAADTAYCSPACAQEDAWAQANG